MRIISLFEAYYFISRDEFSRMVADDDFIEYCEYVGEYYGTPKTPILKSIESGRDVLLDIEIQGTKQICEKLPGAITIFIVPPDMEELERRLRGRGTDSEEKLGARLERARLELEVKDLYDYIVVNDQVARAAREILSIIKESNIKKGKVT